MGCALVALCWFSNSLYCANRLQVQWSSGDVVLADVSGDALDVGQPEANLDGDLVQLGYFTASSANNLFNGEWKALTTDTRIGATSTLSGAAAGTFQFSTVFEVGTDSVQVFPDWPGGYDTTASAVIEQDNPAFGKRLAIRFFDGPELADGVRYNTVAHPDWKWGVPGNPVPFPIIFQLAASDLEMQYQDADQPGVASIMANPDVSDAGIFQVSGSVVGNGTIGGLGKYEMGSTAALTAVADQGHEFAGWSGGLSGDAATQELSVDGDLSVQATFTARTYEVSATVSPSGSGSVSGTGAHEFESSVELEAVPAEGYRFVRWTGLDSGEYDNPVAITVSNDVAVQALFEVAQYSVSTIQSPEEGGQVQGGGIFTHGQQVSVQAVPAEGYLFLRWEGGEVADAYAASTVHTVTGDVILTGVFGLPSESTVQVTLSADPAVGGIVSGAGEYDHGSEVTISVEPADGYYFESWTDGHGVQSYAPSLTVTADANLTYTATYQPYAYRVEILGDARFESQAPTGSGSFALGAATSLSASALEGYSFDAWLVGGTLDYHVLAGTRMDGQGEGYLLDGQERPTLRLYRGVTYRFFLDGDSTLSHPFYFSTTSANDGAETYEGEYLSGVTGSRNSSGTVEITIDEDTPGTLYYHSGSASQAGGTIVVLDADDVLSAPNANPATLTVSGDIAVQATYFEGTAERTLTLVASPDGGGTVSEGGAYNHGTAVQITATPATGYYFTGWTGGAPTDAAASTTIHLGADATLTANFLPNQITVDGGHEGWTYSNWLGFYQRDSSGWVFSLTHGWIYPVGDSDASIFFQTKDGDWYWTSSQVYPQIHLDGHGWLYYSATESTPTDTYFYDYASSRWVVYEPMSLTRR